MSHAKHSEPGRLGWRRVEPRGEWLAEHGPGVDWIDHAVVPQPRSGIERVALLFVLRADRRLEGGVLLGAPLAAFRLDRLAADEREHSRGLLAAHHRDARVRPHPEE